MGSRTLCDQERGNANHPISQERQKGFQVRQSRSSAGKLRKKRGTTSWEDEVFKAATWRRPLRRSAGPSARKPAEAVSGSPAYDSYDTSPTVLALDANGTGDAKSRSVLSRIHVTRRPPVTQRRQWGVYWRRAPLLPPRAFAVWRPLSEHVGQSALADRRAQRYGRRRCRLACRSGGATSAQV